MSVDKDHFKKMFPNLAEEMEETECEENEALTAESEIEGKKESLAKRFNNYEPCIIDFLRRCNNEREAEEIVAYLLKRKEINSESAEKLRKQLRKRGIRSFGSKKENADYLKKAGF